MDRIQLLRRIGACENSLAQPDWTGPKIPPCSEPASFLCESCGRLLCGGHAGGHSHPANQSQQPLASHYQDEVISLHEQLSDLQSQLEQSQQQIAHAQAQTETLQKIRDLAAEA